MRLHGQGDGAEPKRIYLGDDLVSGTWLRAPNSFGKSRLRARKSFPTRRPRQEPKGNIFKEKIFYELTVATPAQVSRDQVYEHIANGKLSFEIELSFDVSGTVRR
jgi:hypothetical protein